MPTLTLEGQPRPFRPLSKQGIKARLLQPVAISLQPVSISESKKKKKKAETRFKSLRLCFSPSPSLVSISLSHLSSARLHLRSLIQCSIDRQGFTQIKRFFSSIKLSDCSLHSTQGDMVTGEVDVSEERYKPAPDFQENSKESLMDISLTDSTELWLIQLPSYLPLDFDGKDVTLNLHKDGKLGEFQNSSGKSLELVSYEFQEPDATIFLSSESESKLVGKVSRRVSLLHYPEPSELEKMSRNPRGQMLDKSPNTKSLSSSSAARQRYMSSIQGSSQRTKSGISRVTKSSFPSSKQRSSLFEGDYSAQRPNKRPANESMRSADRSTLDSLGNKSGSAGNSSDRKLKKVKFEKE